MMPLALTQAQLDQIWSTALPLNLQAQFLQEVAAQLPPTPGDGEVFRACAVAAKAILWDWDTREAG
jgi:hypothetical protein